MTTQTTTPGRTSAARVNVFDYAKIPEGDRSTLQGMALEIRDRVSKLASEACRLGKMLSEARDLIGANTKVCGGAKNANAWGEFCRHELRMEPRTAKRFIDLYWAFGENPPSAMVQTAMERLCRPFVPAAARQEAVERAESGERITTAKAREIIQRHGARPKAGSNRGKAEPLPEVAEETVYKLRSAIRAAIRECQPKRRMALVGQLHDLIDTLWREVEGGESPVGRGASRQGLPPDASEIANRCAAIRDGWSDDERDRRRRA